MRMRAILVALAVIAGAAAQASAAENFIVRGHSYAPGNNQLPPLGSEQDQINLQTDLIEADIYVKERQQKIVDTEMQRFINNHELTGPEQFSLDY
jgi:hypothetical protein